MADDPRRPRVTHFIVYDSPGYRRRYTLCGIVADVRDHSDEPTCADCRRLLDEQEAIAP